METEFTYLSGNSGRGYEFEMTLENAQMCNHQGDCYNEVFLVCQQPYIREQLEKLSNEDLRDIYDNLGLENGDSMSREELEQFVVWVASGNIAEEVNDCDKEKIE